MTAADFAAWVAMMHSTRKWSAMRCAKELGCSYNALKGWSQKGAPQYIGLACTALAQGWPEWKAPPQ